MNRDGKVTMPKRQFRAIREKLNLTRDAFALELGYEGNPSGNTKTINRFDSGRRGIPLAVAKLAWMLEQHGLPDWPDYLEAKPAEPETTGESEDDGAQTDDD